jgi:hypothetical protein
LSEGMKLSSKTEAAPILVSEGTSSSGALQLLADQYRRRLERIYLKAAKKNVQVPLGATIYYNKAEAAVRALYADAT